jgi:hypothetical protein
MSAAARPVLPSTVRREPLGRARGRP